MISVLLGALRVIVSRPGTIITVFFFRSDLWKIFNVFEYLYLAQPPARVHIEDACHAWYRYFQIMV